jgi:hypothetical protein
VLFHDDIVTDREPKTRALSRRFGREKRVEHSTLITSAPRSPSNMVQ